MPERHLAMREEDRDILEEAVRNSGGGEDFDEMLLRATKKHLPRKYHRQFSVILEEILAKADDLGISNRSTAQALLKRPAPPQKGAMTGEDVLGNILGKPPVTPGPEGPVQRPAAPVPPPEKAAPKAPVPSRPDPESPAGETAGDETSGSSVEKLPEEQKILDLGGTSPESLPPELKDKLRKLVKAQKRRQDWEEGASSDEPEPGLFFKGQQRAPPFVPLVRPPKKEDKGTGQEEKPPAEEDEEDLEKN